MAIEKLATDKQKRKSPSSKMEKSAQNSQGLHLNKILSQKIQAVQTDRPMAKIALEGLSVYYGQKHVVKHITMDIPYHQVTAFIGPSGCGKTTVLRCINRMNDFIDSCRVEGEIFIEGVPIYQQDEVNIHALRKNVGMVFQKPNPFPRSIYKNLIYGPKLHGQLAHKADADALVERVLKKVYLWDEVKDRLHENAFGLSVEPRIILLDEPCSALDPISTAKIEELILELKQNYTIVMVTHNMQQAKRISDKTAYFHLGEVVEFGDTAQIFEDPKFDQTRGYVQGEFG